MGTSRTGAPKKLLSNAEIAAGLLQIARELGASAENRYKVRAYQRAAESIPFLSTSLAEDVRAGEDLTRFEGIGKGIAAAIKAIVETGKAAPRPQAAKGRGKQNAASESVSGELILLYDAKILSGEVQEFLRARCAATRVEETGALRRRVEVVPELAYLVETKDFPATTKRFLKFGGGAELIEEARNSALFEIGARVRVRLTFSVSKLWGLSQILATGSPAHLQLLQKHTDLSKVVKTKRAVPDEEAAYGLLGMALVPPELREGGNEVQLGLRKKVPVLVTAEDIRGELHAHSTSSDGAHTIEQMAEAAVEKGYEYLGITDHSQSLKIAGGVSEADLRKQLRRIDKLNAKLKGFRILKSAEVDILADGSLDYPEDLLAQLDYTVCSIHSRFALDKEKQTARLLRAMENPYFDLLGHSTGRLLLRRPGYEIDLPRVIAQAKATHCCFEINASPDRLDLSSEAAREVSAAGIKIAVCTDAHRIQELDWTINGIDVARRAGLRKEDVLNTQGVEALLRFFARKR